MQLACGRQGKLCNDFGKRGMIGKEVVLIRGFVEHFLFPPAPLTKILKETFAGSPGQAWFSPSCCLNSIIISHRAATRISQFWTTTTWFGCWFRVGLACRLFVRISLFPYKTAWFGCWFRVGLACRLSARISIFHTKLLGLGVGFGSVSLVGFSPESQYSFSPERHQEANDGAHAIRLARAQTHCVIFAWRKETNHFAREHQRRNCLST